MPTWSYAILSALLWAISSLVVNIALGRIRAANKLPSILTGVIASSLSGVTTLALLTGPLPTMNLRSVATLGTGGLLTFSVGTLLYYLSAHGFGGRAQIAAQFAKVKPLFSGLIALLILHEPLTWTIAGEMSLIVAGVASLVKGVRAGQLQRAGLIIGMLTAMSWAAGEAIIGYGRDGVSPQAATLVAMIAGAAFTTVVIGVPLLQSGIPRLGAWTALFCLHGILSFGLAYPFFFTAMRELGLAATVVVNAFWPALSMVLAAVLRNRFGTQTERAPRWAWISSGFLAAASILEIGVQMLRHQ